MPPVSLRQAVTYAAVAAIVLAIGWRSMGSSSPPGPSAGYAAAGAPAVSGAIPADPPPTAVVVDVTGAVRRPGVYRLAPGARVQDAIARAGLARRADTTGVNLAARLADGEQVVVPRRGQAPAAAAGTSSPGTAPAIVHLNSATLEELESLDGIGPSLAQRIVDFRTAHGGFRSVEELDQVSGFGPARLAALHGHVAP